MGGGLPISQSKETIMSNQVQHAFFDLHVEGVGYLNRVRTVRPKKGQEFLACTVSAMRGAAGQVEYTKFDCRVSGTAAKEIVRQLEPEVTAKKSVIIGFKLGDIYPEVFTYEKGERKGQQGVSIKGRLLKVKFAKVDGQPITLPESANAAEAAGVESPAAADAATVEA
jgi:hypothetical protein